ncbi:hypothetical protein SAMN05421771_1944 [Granulicella pectinivorans]|uniref:DUF3108 domain-containing protein n=2 Tax=Granulicella pectinivorans TaxID=474950 RepID=A0A1I6M6G7_9BACT|nr:hypothetical protein SAMN05421771_1944 [Granulicella pectinivorans]
MRWTALRFAVVLAISGVAFPQSRLPAYPTIVTSAPYSARRVTTTYEKLADGTQIAHESESWSARNGQGWVWNKQVSESKDALRRDGKKYTNYDVWDPIHRTITSWCDCRKIAYVRLYGDPRVEPPHRQVGAEGMDVYLGPANERLKYRLTPIEGQLIQGEPTEGTEALRVVKAGLDGNDQDLRWSVRSWYSPRLHLALFTIDDSPFHGLRKYEFRDLSTAEPDPKLFQVPEGYQVLPAPEAVR